jgi:hypothetical protein
MTTKHDGTGQGGKALVTEAPQGRKAPESLVKMPARRANKGRFTPLASAELREVAADLRAGKIDAQQAARRIIDQVVVRRVALGLPAATQTELRTLLSELVRKDPSLTARLDRLSKKR